MELPRPFDGNRLLRGDACPAVPSLAGVGGKPGGEFAFAAVSHFDVGSIWQAFTPKLSVDLSYPLFFLDRQDLAVPQPTCNLAGVYDPSSSRAVIRFFDDRIRLRLLWHPFYRGARD